MIRDRVIHEFVLEKILSEEEFYRIYRLVIDKGYIAVHYLRDGEPILRLIALRRKGRLWLRLLLTVITVFTVSLTGYGLTIQFYSFFGEPSVYDTVLWTILYVVYFLGTLALHELGHLFIARRYYVPASGPYFIPAPPIQVGFIGTLGAIISLEGLPPNKKSLALLGITGPLFGFLAATLVCIIGLWLSPTISVEKARELLESGELSEVPFIPLMFLLLMSLKQSSGVLVIHPIAFSAYIVYIVTFLNLMPIGQLDGGHVVRTFTDPYTHSIIGNIVIALIALAGLVTILMGYNGSFYIMLSIILFIFKMIFGSRKHPGPAYALSKTDKTCYLVLALYILLVILCAPVPLV